MNVSAAIATGRKDHQHGIEINYRFGDRKESAGGIA